MKVFVTGATGFVGRSVAARLIEDGHEVRCLVRHEESDEAAYLKGLGAKLSMGDILDAGTFIHAVKGSQALIHLVGIIFERRGASFHEIHVHGTMNALVAAATNKVERFVYMSALGTGPEAKSVYHQTKWEAEEAVRASDIPYTIFRPSTIFGADSELFQMLFGQVRRLPFVPVIGDGRYRMQPISVRDVAACFSNCIDNENAAVKTYELGGPEALSYNDVIDTICRVMGKKRRKLHSPVGLVKPVAWLSEHLQSKPMLTTDQLTMLLNDNVCDIKAMRGDLRVEPVGLEAGLREMLHPE